MKRIRELEDKYKYKLGTTKDTQKQTQSQANAKS